MKPMTQEMANQVQSHIGQRAFFMMGAKNLGWSETGGFTFQIKGCPDVTHIRVTVEDDDTYRVEFLKIRGTKPPVTFRDMHGVYVESLNKTIEENTGLRLSL